MSYLAVCADPFSLSDLSKRVCSSSNFRFAWQFYCFSGIDPRSPEGIRKALDSIIATPDLHRFLRDSYEKLYDPEFTTQPVHDHCRIVASNSLESTLASAAADHLGAYSRELRDSNHDEIQEVSRLFSSIGDYISYELLPGTHPDCSRCLEYNHHLFSTWFYGVAWDWCLFASWPKKNLMWIGCLTDTD